jgi:hypothetical protein
MARAGKKKMDRARNRAERRFMASNRYPIEPIGVSPLETAHMIRGSRSTVYRLLARGDLSALKRGASTLVTLASIRAYQARLPPATFGAADRSDASHT